MQIDWFTVGAQVVNFLILVLLLKKFLYQPVINAMERREQALLQRKQSADNEAEIAHDQLHLYQQKIEELERHKEELLNQARLDAEMEKEKLLQKLRADITDEGVRWRTEVDRDKEAFMADTRQIMGKEIVRSIRRILSDLANVELQDAIIKQFLLKLDNLSEPDKVKLEAALVNLDSSKLTIVSSFTIPAVQQQQIINTLKSLSSTHIELRTEIDPNLVCGLKLQLPGEELEWNVESYLTELQDGMVKNLSSPKATR